MIFFKKSSEINKTVMCILGRSVLKEDKYKGHEVWECLVLTLETSWPVRMEQNEMIGRLAADGMLCGQRQDIKWRPDWG